MTNIQSVIWAILFIIDSSFRGSNALCRYPQIRLEKIISEKRTCVIPMWIICNRFSISNISMRIVSTSCAWTLPLDKLCLFTALFAHKFQYMYVKGHDHSIHTEHNSTITGINTCSFPQWVKASFTRTACCAIYHCLTAGIIIIAWGYHF